MPPKRGQKTAARDVVSKYDIHKVHIPYISKDSTSTYLPRSAPKKAALLQERLLNRVAQKQQTGPTTTSGHRAPSPQLPQLPKRGNPASKPSSKPSTSAALQDRPPPKPKLASRKQKGAAKKIAEPFLPPQSSNKLAEESQEEEGEEEEDPDIVTA
jgi:hypothetical protein